MGKLKEIDINHVWHPFTQMAAFTPEEDLIMVKGVGNYLHDEEGRRYFDATASLWVNMHGHNHPLVNAALRRQVGRLAHSTLLGIGNEPAALLAARLTAAAPAGLNRLFYSDNGSTSVEVALKMAFQYWRHKGATGRQRTRFVALANGYHGDTIGSVSVGGMELFHSLFRPLLFDALFAPSPNCYRCPLGLSHPGCALACAGKVEELLAEHGETIAALLIEPCVQGAGGIVVYPPEVLTRIAAAARRHGVLLIADEVATGFGRTGRLFACDWAGIVPDLMCVAKGLTGGYLPVAATLVQEPVYKAFLARWEEFRTFFHGHTYTGNPLGCAAALASLDEVLKPDFLPRINRLSAALRDRLGRLQATNPHVGNCRLLGLMGGIELVADKSSREPLPYQRRTGHHVCLAAREAGVLARPLGDVLVVMPPLSATEDELLHLVDSLEWAIERTLDKSRRPAPQLPRRLSTDHAILRELAGCRPAERGRRLLVTGTDTGVGKTAVTMALAAAAAAAGQPLCAWKPVESGVLPGQPTDASRLAEWSTVPGPLATTSLRQPLSPHLAARLEGRQVPVAEIVSALIPAREEWLLVEGAGGLLVKLDDHFCFADLAREADLPVLIVAANRLGCLNHTMMTVKLAHDLGLAIAGIVLHEVDARPDDPSRQHNEQELAALFGPLLLPSLPFLPDPDDRTALATAGGPILRALTTVVQS